MENTKTKSRKKLATVVGVGVLAAALAGGGALTTMYTSILGNEFNANVLDSEDLEAQPLLELVGTPIDHLFELDRSTHEVIADWTLVNHGEEGTTFDGKFQPLQGIDPELAEALVVYYGLGGETADTVTAWHPGGTVAEPRTFAAATGSGVIGAGEEIPVVVKVQLADPSLIASDDEAEIGQPLQVVADFVVDYLDPRASA